MTNITFDDNLITGNETIDTQHQELIDRIQKEQLARVMQKTAFLQKSPNFFRPRLHFLRRQAAAHAGQQLRPFLHQRVKDAQRYFRHHRTMNRQRRLGRNHQVFKIRLKRNAVIQLDVIIQHVADKPLHRVVCALVP